jgi:hypothetical protein
MKPEYDLLTSTNLKAKAASLIMTASVACAAGLTVRLIGFSDKDVRLLTAGFGLGSATAALVALSIGRDTRAALDDYSDVSTQARIDTTYAKMLKPPKAPEYELIPVSWGSFFEAYTAAPVMPVNIIGQDGHKLASWLSTRLPASPGTRTVAATTKEPIKATQQVIMGQDKDVHLFDILDYRAHPTWQGLIDAIEAEITRRKQTPPNIQHQGYLFILNGVTGEIKIPETGYRLRLMLVNYEPQPGFINIHMGEAAQSGLAKMPRSKETEAIKKLWDAGEYPLLICGKVALLPPSLQVTSPDSPNLGRLDR